MSQFPTSKRSPSVTVTSFVRSLLLLGWVACCGCGKTYDASVQGLATLDGQPLDRGAILFHPDDKSGATAYGHIGTDGHFVMRIGQGNDNRNDAGGIQSGSYTVTIAAREDPTPNSVGGPPTPGGLITPAAYAELESTPIKVNIHAGENLVALELDGSMSATNDEARSVEESRGVENGRNAKSEVPKPESLNENQSQTSAGTEAQRE